MSPRFAAGTLVEYAGARWHVKRALGAEAILLRSDTGAEVSADPLKIRLPEITEPIGPSLQPIDELRYSGRRLERGNAPPRSAGDPCRQGIENNR